jgi:hypothetical protein
LHLGQKTVIAVMPPMDLSKKSTLKFQTNFCNEPKKNSFEQKIKHTVLLNPEKKLRKKKQKK